MCNTDNQALAESPVPVKLQLGKEGLGAGNRPARAREAAEESIEDVKHMLNDGCKMVFITAGMGEEPEPVLHLSLPKQPKTWISLPWV